MIHEMKNTIHGYKKCTGIGYSVELNHGRLSVVQYRYIVIKIGSVRNCIDFS